MEVDVPIEQTNGQVVMTVERALENVRQACAAFTGNLQQHAVIQESLQVLAEALE